MNDTEKIILGVYISFGLLSLILLGWVFGSPGVDYAKGLAVGFITAVVGFGAICAAALGSECA